MQRRVTTGTVRVSSESKWLAAWLVLAAVVTVVAALVFSRWYSGLIGWQLDRFGWYLPTATPALLVMVPVAIVLVLAWRLLTRRSPADPIDLARRLARALALLAALSGAVALIAAAYAWLHVPTPPQAWPRRTLAQIEATPMQGPVEIADAAPDSGPVLRLAVLREDTPAFGGETAYVLLHHPDGTPARILAEAVADPQPPYRRVIRRGYLQAYALPDPVLARLSGDSGSILVLLDHPRAMRRVPMIVALQALAFTLILGLAACVMARRVKVLKQNMPHRSTGQPVTNSA